MNNEAREYFEVTKCTNPVHSFKIGRLIGQWQIADDKWITITDRGDEVTHWLRFGKHRAQEGATIYEIIVWKLSIIWGFV
jgi:hypothetical protein